MWEGHITEVCVQDGESLLSSTIWLQLNIAVKWCSNFTTNPTGTNCCLIKPQIHFKKSEIPSVPSPVYMSPSPAYWEHHSSFRGSTDTLLSDFARSPRHCSSLLQAASPKPKLVLEDVCSLQPDRLWPCGAFETYHCPQSILVFSFRSLGRGSFSNCSPFVYERSAIGRWIWRGWRWMDDMRYRGSFKLVFLEPHGWRRIIGPEKTCAWRLAQFNSVHFEWISLTQGCCISNINTGEVFVQIMGPLVGPVGDGDGIITELAWVTHCSSLFFNSSLSAPPYNRNT